MRGPSPANLQAVIYYTPTKAALPLLEFLDEFYAGHPTFTYAVRYAAPKEGEGEQARTKLSGYGVEMALKKTDYPPADKVTQCACAVHAWRATLSRPASSTCQLHAN